MTTESAQFQWRRGTAAANASANEILLAGEPGMEDDTLKWKLGDGSSTWSALPYQGGQPPLIPTALKTGAYTAAPGDFAIFDCTGASRTLTLPTGPPDKSLIGAKPILAATGHSLTVTCGAGDAFDDGQTSHTLQLGQSATMQYIDALNMWLVSDLSLSLGLLSGLYVPLPASGAAVDDILFVSATSPVALTYSPRDCERIDFSLAGQLALTTGQHRAYVERACTIVSVRVSVGTDPVGAPVVVDLLKNGSTIYAVNPGNKPTIAAAGSNQLADLPDTPNLTAGQYLTMNVDGIGSTTPGSDLTVTVRVMATS